MNYEEADSRKLDSDLRAAQAERTWRGITERASAARPQHLKDIDAAILALAERD